MQERQLTVPQRYRDALPRRRSLGRLPAVLGRSPHGGLQQRPPELLTRTLGTEAHEQ